MLRRHGVVWLLALLHSSCTEHVRVGELGGEVPLDACMGKNTHCDTGLASLPLAEPPSPELTRAQCELEDDDTWRVAWSRELTHLRCAPLGYCDATEIAFAEDGTFWAAGFGFTPVADTTDTLAGLFLTHYGSDGDVLASEVIDTVRLDEFEWIPSEVSLAPSSRGRVTVATLWSDQGWVGEFDGKLQPVGERVRLTGLSEEMNVGLSRNRDGDVYLIASDDRWMSTDSGEVAGPSVLAKLDSHLQPLWIQSQALPGSHAQASLMTQQTPTLVAHNSVKLPESTVGITTARLIGTYDATGNLARMLALPLDVQPYGLDREGNVLALSADFVKPFRVSKLTPQGDVVFSVAVIDLPAPEHTPSFGALLDTDGTSYFAHHQLDGSTGRDLITLVRLSADGERCTRSHVVNEVPQLRQSSLELTDIVGVFKSESGDLYFRTETAIGRFAQGTKSY